MAWNYIPGKPNASAVVFHSEQFPDTVTNTFLALEYLRKELKKIVISAGGVTIDDDVVEDISTWSSQKIVDYAMPLPAVAGTDGQVLTVDSNGDAIWADQEIVPDVSTGNKGDVLGIDSNGKLAYLSAGAASGGDKITNTGATMSAIGGIPANTTLTDKTCIEVLEMMLFPYTKPVISNVTLNRTPSGTVYEKGTTVSINSISTSIQKKSEAITKVQFYVNNTMKNEITTGVANGGTFTYTPTTAISITDTITNTYVQVKVEDGKSSVTANSLALTFVYPYYHGSIADGTVVNDAVIQGLTKDVSIKGTKTYNYNTSNSCMVIAYPASYGNIRTIIDPNGFDITGSFTKSQVVVTANDSTSQTYNVYVSSASTNSNFAVKFNI